MLDNKMLTNTTNVFWESFSWWSKYDKKINRKNINNNIISDLTGAEALDLKRLFLPEGFFDLCIP